MDMNKRNQWEQYIADYKGSGMPAKAWCEANNVSFHTLRAWITKLNKENKSILENKTENPPKWVEIKTIEPEQEIRDAALVISIGKAIIKVTPDFDSEFLKEVVRTLSSIC